MSPGTIVRRAVEVSQVPDHPIYLFALTADELLQIADVSRISRGNEGQLIGYQRQEVRKHVDGIVDYLNSDGPLFPNSIILALSSDVRFRSSRGPGANDGHASGGTLEIPLPAHGDAKPAWIVDGQQRTVALSKAKNRSFPVPITAFVADAVGLQRDQFLRINNTHPLPRGLVSELLPEVASPLPPRLAARKLPAAICEQLNRDPTSPFHGLIRRASSTSEERKSAVITDASLIEALHESLNSPGGCLFSYRNLATGETDVDGIWALILCYWSAVRETFPNAWGLPPTKSRLMHGVGIRAMGRLMDRIMSSVNPLERHAAERVSAEVEAIAPDCRWTEGTWTELGLAWNELQNVPKHIRMLSNYLIRLHVQHRMGRA